MARCPDVVHEAMVVLEAALTKEELARVVPGYPFPDLYDHKQRADG